MLLILTLIMFHRFLLTYKLRDNSYDNKIVRIETLKDFKVDVLMKHHIVFFYFLIIFKVKHVSSSSD